MRKLAQPITRSLSGRLSVGIPPYAFLALGEITFPEKTSYFNDFTSVANSTKLRDLPGWAAYSSVGSTHASRDQWQVQGEAITRMSVSNDYTATPGYFVIGRDTGTLNHVLRAKMATIPNSGSSLILVVAAFNQSDCVLMECANASGIMQSMVVQKSVGGTLTTLATIVTSSTQLGRRLQAGDDIEFQVLGQFVHLFVNGRRVTPSAGLNLDTGGAFIKGPVVGFGTRGGTGCVLDNVYVAGVSASLTVGNTPIFWPGSLLAGGRFVPFSGAYTGDVQALDYRVLNTVTLAVVKDWSRAQSPIISGGVWSASVFVPMCDTAVNPKVCIQVRAANDVDAKVTSGTTTVGFSVGSYGQSNSFYRGLSTATSHAVSNAYTWGTSAGSVWRGGESTTTERSQLWASILAQALGVPCGVTVAGVGSASISSLVGVNWPSTVQILEDSNSKGYVDSWLWTQGEAESEAAAPVDVSSYRGYFDTLLGLLGTVSVTATPKVGICVIGKSTTAHISGQVVGDANWSTMRATHIGMVDKPNVYVAAGLYDAAMVDALHYTANAYVENGRRVGMSMRKALGYGGYDGRGPLITGAVRSGAVITLPLNLNGAASVSGTGLTNYDVSTDSFATTKAISSVAVSGSSIVITLAADPGGPVKVRSFYGMTYGTPTRAVGAYSDGTTIPVEPLYVPITSA